jgi:hypothetical protein
MLTGTDIGIWILAAFLLLLLYVSFLTLWRHSRGFREAFEALATKRGGKAVSGFFAFPSAVFPLGETRARLRGAYASQYSSNFVEVEVPAPGPWPGRLTVYPHGYHTAILALFHGRRVKTRDPRFDKTFVVYASDPGLVEPVVDADTRGALLAAGSLGREGDVVLLVHPTSLKLRKHNVTPDAEVLDALVATAETLVSKLEALRRGIRDIAFVSQEKPVPGTCPVCGSDLESDVVWCKRCGVPHHRDCWKFNRGCAAFACGGRRFARRAPTH